MSLENKLKEKIKEWENINIELAKLDSEHSKQVIAVHREHIQELKEILESEGSND